MKTYFISGHLDITQEEFDTHYVPKLEAALEDGEEGVAFVVGDARGADTLAQAWLAEHGAPTAVYHMLEKPRNLAAGPYTPLVGGFPTDEARDEAMTEASTHDIAWARPGKPGSKPSGRGTLQNLARREARREAKAKEAERDARRALPRYVVTETEAYPVYHIRDVSERPDYPTTPIPAELIERQTAAFEAWYIVQAEIGDWVRRQENDPV